MPLQEELRSRRPTLFTTDQRSLVGGEQGGRPAAAGRSVGDADHRERQPIVLRRPQLRPLVDAGELLRLSHQPPDRHDERYGSADLLFQPRFGRVEVAAPIGLADHVADALLQHRVPIMLEMSKAHGSVKLGDRRREVRCGRADLHHLDLLRP